MKMSQTTLRRFLEHIVLTRAEELDCEQVYHVIHVFVERAVSGEDTAALFPLIQQHLELCSDCYEECETLLRALKVSSRTSRTPFLGVIPQVATFHGATYQKT